jgi:glycerol-3-phosphate dehydrogenase
MKLLILFSVLYFQTLAANTCIETYITKKSSSIPREANIIQSESKDYDVVIIGGGSAGLGSALDAISRGLKPVVIEANDFAGETSSKSTKLLHGGVRYLEQLWKKLITTGKLDKTLLNLITDALHERKTVISNAPYLAKPIALMTPIYSTIEIPYYWAGLKMYDLLAGSKGKLPSSHFISAKEIIKKYPHIKTDGLKGGVIYYDGQFNDTRLAISLAKTAQTMGGDLINYTKVISLQKNNGKIIGVEVQDQLTNKKWIIKGKSFINATGPFADKIRIMDDPNVKPMISGASGTHLVIDKKFSIPEMGILIPKTTDGRVIFILPWEGHTLIGTTDNKSEVISKPKTTEEDINYILNEVSKYFSVSLERQDVQSYWTGIRPLVSDPEAADTSQLARDHVVNVNPNSGLITLTGGKWTTYRVMGMHAMDKVIDTLGLDKENFKSQTATLKLAGSEGFHKDYNIELIKTFSIAPDVANHFATNYGTNSSYILKKYTNSLNRLHPQHPFLEAEVLYGIQHESARKITDIISRRFRLSMLDLSATKIVLNQVADIMAKELGWNKQQLNDEITQAKQELQIY